MDKNLRIAEQVLQYVGGAENVNEVFHCATRLRFRLKDEGRVDEEALKKVDGVVGITNSAGLFQIIIGQNVEQVYEHLCRIGSFTKEEVIEENLDKELDKVPDKYKKIEFQKIGNNILAYIAESITPIIYPFLGAALWYAIGVLLGPSVLNVVGADSPFYITTDLLYDALTFFLPIYVGYNAAKALKLSNPVWGMLVGGLTIIPDFIAMAGTVDSFQLFGFIKVPVANYGTTVLPVLLGVWIFSYLYKLLKKIISELIFGTIAPFLIYFVMAVFMLGIAAPLGTYVGELLSTIFLWMYNSILPVRIIGYALMTTLWPILTMCGMHLPISMTAIAIMSSNGGDTFILPCACCAVWVLYGMALGAAIKFKKKENKNMAISAFVAGFVGAVCEPCIYGIALKSKSALRVMIGVGLMLGIVIAITQPVYYNLSTGNIIGVFATWSGAGSLNIIKGIGCEAFALVAGAVGTVMFGKFEE